MRLDVYYFSTNNDKDVDNSLKNYNQNNTKLIYLHS